MAPRLLTKSQTKISNKTGVPLTKQTDTSFCIIIAHQLENNYCFKNLKERDIKALHSFIDKTIGKRVGEVDELYLRDPDIYDKYGDDQVHHYKVNEAFRLHGYFREGKFHLLRLDPRHEKHKE